MKRYRNKRERRFGYSGFTLVEILMTIIVIGIISGVSIKIMMSGFETFSFIKNKDKAYREASYAMDTMVSDLVALSWWDLNSIMDSSLEYRGTSFKRKIVNGKLVLARGNDVIATPLGIIDFDYYKSDGETAFWTIQVSLIDIELSIETFKESGSVDLRTEVFLRSRMYEDFSRL